MTEWVIQWDSLIFANFGTQNNHRSHWLRENCCTCRSHRCTLERTGNGNLVGWKFMLRHDTGPYPTKTFKQIEGLPTYEFLDQFSLQRHPVMHIREFAWDGSTCFILSIFQLGVVYIYIFTYIYRIHPRRCWIQHLTKLSWTCFVDAEKRTGIVSPELLAKPFCNIILPGASDSQSSSSEKVSKKPRVKDRLNSDFWIFF